MDDFQSPEDILASVLGDSVNSKDNGNTAVLVRKDNYRELVRLRNVTSYSMQQKLHECPRKFQLYKLEADANEPNEAQGEGNPDFAFGHAVGAGVAAIDAGTSSDEAVFQAFLAWNIDLFAEKQTKTGRDPKKSFHHALWAIELYPVFRADETDLREYDVVKNEATIAVDFENGHLYTGHIDTILRHRSTGRYKVKENKTTVFGTVHPALYENSDQALSYSVVLDSFGASEYDVLYTIYSTSEQRWLQFEFTKSNRAKAEWIQGQFFVHSDIEAYEEANFFPKRGGSCLTFGRPCEYFGSCDFNSGKVFGKNFSGLESAAGLETLSSIEPTDFAFKVSDLLANLHQRTQENI
jgi:hypothetical protein